MNEEKHPPTASDAVSIVPRSSHRALEREVESAAGGAVVGAIAGAMAGPPGVAVGAVLGGVAGGIAGAAMVRASATAALRARELDEQIGVIGGELGAPNLDHPPAKMGAYSAASAGVAISSGGGLAEGPIQSPE